MRDQLVVAGVKAQPGEWTQINQTSDADAIAAATVQTSAVIIYTLYDSSWRQDVSSVGCIVV